MAQSFEQKFFGKFTDAAIAYEARKIQELRYQNAISEMKELAKSANISK